MSSPFAENTVAIEFTGEDARLLQALQRIETDLKSFGRTGSEAVRNLDAASRSASDGIDRLAHGMRVAFIGGGITAAIITTKNAIAGVTLSMLDAQMQADKVKNSLSFAMGSQEAAAEIEYLRNVTNKLGVSFSALAPMYGRLAAATKDTNLQGKATREIFESIAQASVVMGLSADEAEGALRAVVQMISKGQIQAEELRGQLGERLPRAFQLFAESMGVTTAELSKLLEAGKVAPEQLERFAATLKTALGGSVEEASQRLSASINRLGNEWLRLKQVVAEAGVASMLSSGASAVSADMEAFSDAVQRAKSSGLNSLSALSAGVGTLIGRSVGLHMVSDAFRSNAENAAEFARNLPKAQEELARLQQRANGSRENIYLTSEIAQLQAYINKAKEAQRVQAALMGGVGQNDNEGIRAQGIAREKYLKQQAEDAKELVRIKGQLAGQDTHYLDTLGRLVEMRAKGTLTESEYVAVVSDLAKKNYHAVKSHKDHADAFSGVRDAAKEWADVIKDADRNLLDAAGRTDNLTRSEKRLQEYLQSPAYQLNSQAMRDLAEARLKDAIAAERQALAYKALAAEAQEDIRIQEELDAAYVADSKAREQGRLALDAYIQSLGDQAQREEFELSLIGRTEQARRALTAVYQIQLDLKKQIEAIDANPGFNEEQRTEERARARAAAAAAASGVVRREETRMWAEAGASIADTLTNAILNGGENAARDLPNLFKNLVLRPTVSAVVQTGVNTLGNAMGLGNIMGAAGTISGVGNLATMAGLGGVGGIFGSSAAYGAALGTTSVGVGSQAAMLAQQTGVFGSAGASATAAAAGNGVVGGLMTAAPYLAALAVVSSLFEDDSGTYHTGASSRYSAAQGLTSATPDAVGWFGGVPGMATAAFSAETQALTDTLVKSVAGALDSTAKAFGKKVGYEVMTATADDTSDGGRWGAMTISLDGKAIVDWAATQTSRWAPKEFADGAAGQAQYTAAVAASVRDTLRAMDLPGWAASVLDQLGNAPTLESLSAALDGINATQTAMHRLGDTMGAFADLSDRSVTALLAATGGINNLAAAADAYYQTYYSESERVATSTRQMTEALAAVGLQLPTSTQALRTMLETSAAAGESGMSQVAALLQIQGTFLAVTKANAEAEANRKALAADPVLAGLSDAQRAALAEAMGGISALQRATSSYLGRFYTDAEQAAFKAKTLADSLAEVGLQMPATVGEFDALLKTSLALGDTDAVAALLKASDAFDQVAASASAVTEAALDQARANATTLVDYQRAVARIRMGEGAGTTSASTALPASALGFDAYTTSAVTAASYTAPTAVAGTAGADASAALAAEVRALRTEVEGLRAEARATALNTAATTRLLDRVSEGGDAVRTVAA